MIEHKQHNTHSEATKFIHFIITKMCLSCSQYISQTSTIHFKADSSVLHGIFLICCNMSALTVIASA